MAYQYPLNGGRINASISGNTAGAHTLVSSGTMVLSGGNNITLSQNGNTIGISAANAPSGSINFSAGTTSSNLNSIVFSNSGGVSFGLNGGTITGTVATNYAALNHSHGNPALNLTNLSGTTASASNGLTLSLSAPAVSSLSQTGIVSLSQNGNTISIGAPAFSAGIASNSTVTNQVIFSAGNNISLSQSTNTNGATIAIHGTSGGGGVAVGGPSGNTFTSGTVNFGANNTGAITVASTTGQQLNFAVPATSMLSAGAGINISTTGSTVVFQSATASNTINGASVARWEYPTQGFNIINAIATNSASVQHVQVPYNVSGSAIRLAVSLNASSMTTSGTTATIGLSMLVGISSLNGSTLSSIASGSNTTSFSYSSGNYITSLYNGVREMTAPLAITMTPGEYWIGAIIKSAQTSGTATMSVMGLGLSNINTSGSIGTFGSAISAYARDAYMGQGMYGTSTTGMPASIGISGINNTSAGNLHRAAFYHAIYSALY